MDPFFRRWRRRFVANAVLLLAVAGVVGLGYQEAITNVDYPCAAAASQCQTAATSAGLCPTDHPCLSDSVAEHRFSSAHQQALLHALLLLAVAFGAPYFRVGKRLFSAVAWLLILACWGAPIAGALEAWATYPATYAIYPFKVPFFKTLSLDPLFAEFTRLIAMIGGIAMILAMLVLVGRSAWELVREAIAPQTWWNWACLVSARPRFVYEPGNLSELVANVQMAIDNHLHVRAFGGRYSWSGIAPTDDVMIDMRRLNTVGAPVEIDSASTAKWCNGTSHTVTVDAGATIRSVSETLAAQGLMLATTPVNPWVQVGGALALGCHGTGVKHEPFTRLVTELRIVQYNPATWVAQLNAYLRPDIPGSTTTPTEWDALMVNLGCLGVMYQVTFECMKLYNVHILDTSLPMEATIENEATLNSIVMGNQFSEIFWFPYNDECFVRTWNPTSAPAAPFDFWFWAEQWLVAKLGGGLIFLILALMPFLTPLVMRLFHTWFGNLNAHVPAPDAMQYQRYFLPVFDVGHAIPISSAPNGFAAFQEAWFEVVDRLASYRHRAVYPQNLAMHVRFGQGATALLAPNGGGPTQHWAFIEILTHANTPLDEEHFETIERAWYGLGGRPHWAKMSYDVSLLLSNYPNVDVIAFTNVRQAMDPRRVFLNDYVREALQL
jgi:L-gulonolactone oxidase